MVSLLKAFQGAVDDGQGNLTFTRGDDTNLTLPISGGGTEGLEALLKAQEGTSNKIVKVSRVNHVMALDSLGNVYTWGPNNHGQLGNGSTTDETTPQNISAVSGSILNGKVIVDISAGASFSMALDSLGNLYTWGRNDYYQLGDGSTTQRNLPIDISTSGSLNSTIQIQSVSAGQYYSMALDTNGKVYTWGRGYKSPLGTGDTNDKTRPYDISSIGALSGKTIKFIVAGPYHSGAISTDDRVIMWGDNHKGEVGIGRTGEQSSPVDISSVGDINGKRIIALSLVGGFEQNFSLGLDDNGSMYAWGFGARGQIGRGSTSDTFSPLSVYTDAQASGSELASTTKIVAIATGNGASFGVSDETDGRQVYAFGLGSLGDGINDQKNLPIKIPNLRGIESLMSGHSGGSYAVSLDGRVYNWGLSPEKLADFAVGSAGFIQERLQINVENDENKALSFKTGTQEHMIITTEGAVGIGTLNPSSDFKLDVGGDINVSGITYNASDKRYKKNIRPIEGVLEKLALLNGVTFQWRKDGEQEDSDICYYPNILLDEDGNPLDVDCQSNCTYEPNLCRHMGLIAQEVQLAFPEAVHTNSKTGKMSVSYENLVGALVEASKVLSKKLEHAESRLKEAELTVTKLVEDVDQLKLKT